MVTRPASRARAPLAIGLAVLAGCGSCGVCDGDEPARDETPAAQTKAGASAPSWTEVAAGARHACALRRDGRVACWGANVDGQLGDGTDESRATAAAVEGLDDAVALAGGGYHTCALREGGGVRCWGQNAHGQLGDGTRDTRRKPVAVTGIDEATMLRAGGATTCVATGKDVSCWGRVGSAGHHTPVAIDGVEAPVAMAVGPDGGACAVDEAGTLRCWGSVSPPGEGAADADDAVEGNGNMASSEGPPTAARTMGVADVASVALGKGRGCVRRKDGTVACWRSRGGKLRAFSWPTDVEGLDVGRRHACLRRQSGAVLCWGANERGQLGRRHGNAHVSPVAVARVQDTQALSVGHDHACATMGEGVKCWGDGRFGQRGDGQHWIEPVPVEVDGLPDTPAELALGEGHTCARLGSGRVFCWGLGTGGQLGHGKKTVQFEPAAVKGLHDAGGVVAGSHHTCARRASGDVVCWGDGALGQLGIGSREPQAEPAPVTDPLSGLEPVAALAAGVLHTCARDEAGRLRCWGGVSTPSWGRDGGVTAGPWAGGTRACAWADPRLRCWGRNVHLPETGVKVADLEQVALGRRHACWVAGGSVRCWGHQEAGQLGAERAAGARGSRVAVEGLDQTEIVAVAAGDRHSCALSGEGHVWCWGGGELGQLGDGTVRDRRRPVRVSHIDDARGLWAGAEHTCALPAEGKPLCWGANGRGQLGHERSVPDPPAAFVRGLESLPALRP